MSLPPALLQRLAQRGLVQKQKPAENKEPITQAATEEVIAEDYDEMETDNQNAEEYQYPSQYETTETTQKRTEDNFWLERMRARMGDTVSVAGYKGCPNKYNIWHKCTLYCVNRWADGKPEPSRDYMKRYKRLLRKYPLPKGWTDMYDTGCGCYYFYSTTENLVSWLPPTHPKSQITKSAAVLRRQLEESTGNPDSDIEQHSDDEITDESNSARHEREIDDIISYSMRPRSPPSIITPQDFPSLQEVSGVANTVNTVVRKQKSRDLERTISRKRRDREKELGRANNATNGARRAEREDVLDPMDPSAYSDTPRGKWSDGLQTAAEERKKPATTEERARSGKREKRERHSDSEDMD